MKDPRIAAWLVFALGLSLGGPVVAGVEGSCERDGRSVRFVDGVAWAVIEAWDLEAGIPAWELGFATMAIDKPDVWRAPADRRGTAFSFQAMQAEGDAASLTLRLLRVPATPASDEQDAREGEDRVDSQTLWLSPGTTLSSSGSSVGEIVVEHQQAGRIAGHYRFDDGAERCTVRFDIEVIGDRAAAPPLPGTALPADGGAPGQAVLASNRALLAGDLDALAALLPPERVEMMRAAQRNDPGFDRQFDLMRSFAPQEMAITGGRVDGDRAWVEFIATQGGEPIAGTTELHLRDGRWYIDTETTRARD